MQLFPEQSDRAKLVKSPQHAAIWELIESLPEPEIGDAPPREEFNGKILVRVPSAVHASLVQEAELEGVSLNQLILSKLCVQLKAVV